MKHRPHPPALAHGEIRELFSDIFFVTGTTRLPGPIAVNCSRNMTVLRQGGSLTLVNSVRLDEAGLAALRALGSVDHVLRIAGFHGMDDAFYKEELGAKVWALEGQAYVEGFSGTGDESSIYFQPDVWVTKDTELPVDAELIWFPTSSPAEALVHLRRDGGILVAGDALQNWRGDPYFNLLGRTIFRIMGFIKPHNVGPGWVKQAKPARSEIAALLEVDFEHVLPAHGEPVMGGAKAAYTPVLRSFA